MDTPSDDALDDEAVCSGCLTPAEDESETQAFVDLLTRSAARAERRGEAALLYGLAFVALDNLETRLATLCGPAPGSHGDSLASRN